MEDSIITLVIIMVIAAIFIYSLPYLIMGGVAYLLYKATITFLRYLKGGVETYDHLAAIAAGALPIIMVLYDKGWVPGLAITAFLGLPLCWIMYHLCILQFERSGSSMKHTGDDHTTPPSVDKTFQQGSIEPPEATPLPAPSSSPLADLYVELGEILNSGDRSLLSQRLRSIKRSMDAASYEKNISAWLRKFKISVQVMETMNNAERMRMDHEFMPLERQKREAELKADIEHHKAREAEARMRQRMAQEE